MTYKLLTNSDDVLRIADNVRIPKDLRNRDWRGYLQWRAQGNTPQPADAPPAAPPDYQGFYDAVLGSALFPVIRARARQSVTGVSSIVEFGLAFSDAKLGKPNIPAIQASVNGIVEDLNLTTLEKAAIRQLMRNFNLDTLFTIP